MTDRNQNKGQRPWLQWVTLGVASLAMVFSLITSPPFIRSESGQTLIGPL